MTSASKTISFSKVLLYASLILGVIISLGAFPSVALAQDPGDTPTPTATETYTNTPEPSPTPDSSTPTETPEATTEEPTATVTIDATLTATQTGTATQTATPDLTATAQGVTYALGQPLQLEGWLSMIWGDDATLNTIQQISFLTLEDGSSIQLAIHPSQFSSFGGAASLIGVKVAVSGVWAAPQMGAEDGVLQVTNISMLSGRMQAMGAEAPAVSGAKPYINILCRFSNATGVGAIAIKALLRTKWDTPLACLTRQDHMGQTTIPLGM